MPLASTVSEGTSEGVREWRGDSREHAEVRRLEPTLRRTPNISLDCCSGRVRIVQGVGVGRFDCSVVGS
jgi:hypothetical protein